jgi:indole-3-glycerol phosphate synthase
MTILSEIIENKREELIAAKKRLPLKIMKEKAGDRTQPTLSLLQSLNTKPTFHFLCEIKKASPSQGLIQPQFNPVVKARAFLESGADAISVLTDQKFFQGTLDHLKRIKDSVEIPVLRKDFIIDEYQLYEAKAAGADIILLIARVLNKEIIERLINLAHELKLEVLLEIHNQSDIRKIPLNAKYILGINNRNLDNFSVDISKSLKLKEYLPNNLPIISESGIATTTDCKILKEHGFRGALIGEAFMRSNNPKKLLKKFIREVNNVYPT